MRWPPHPSAPKACHVLACNSAPQRAPLVTSGSALESAPGRERAARAARNDRLRRRAPMRIEPHALQGCGVDSSAGEEGAARAAHMKETCTSLRMGCGHAQAAQRQKSSTTGAGEKELNSMRWSWSSNARGVLSKAWPEKPSDILETFDARSLSPSVREDQRQRSLHLQQCAKGQPRLTRQHAQAVEVAGVLSLEECRARRKSTSAPPSET